ncbi:hypothetical protein [Neobacillus sp. FSL H8-0543]|uniref:hypothetical protein n=1 Tax=Neobacillus sp. FSL H8-0543 TaxID=2954672 RepID=UPI0031595B82
MINVDNLFESIRTNIRLHENVAVAPKRSKSPILKTNFQLTDSTKNIPKMAMELPIIIRNVIFSFRNTAANPAVIKGDKLKIKEALVAVEYFRPVNKKI